MRTLYEDLGVAADADRDALAKAHRKAVKQHHPDAGGDRDQFERVQRAWLVLSNPAKRQRYDETGQVDDDPDNDLSRLSAIIVGTFEAVLADSAEVMDRIDMIAKMTACLRIGVIEGRRKIAETKRARRRLEGAKKRLSFDGDGPDIIGRALEERLRQADASIQHGQAEVELIERAIEHLKLYGWEFERLATAMPQTSRFATVEWPSVYINPGA